MLIKQLPCLALNVINVCICSKCGFVWVWYHYIWGDYSWHLNIMLLVICHGQTCCLSCKLMRWYVTSEMRAKIRPADWRRASKITGGISCWAGPWLSGSWPVNAEKVARIISCGELTVDLCEMICSMLAEIYDRINDLLNGWMWCQYNGHDFV